MNWLSRLDWQKIFFLPKSKWTCLPNMVSLAHWEQVSSSYYYSYASSQTPKIGANEPARLRNIATSKFVFTDFVVCSGLKVM